MTLADGKTGIAVTITDIRPIVPRLVQCCIRTIYELSPTLPEIISDFHDMGCRQIVA